MTCCEVTYTTRTTYYTALPLSKRKAALIGTLSLVSFAQEFFDRSEEIDRLKALSFIVRHLKNPCPLSLMENEVLESCLTLDTDASFHKSFKRMRGSLRTHPFINAFECNAPGRKQSSWSKVIGVVDTSAEQVLAFLWEFMSFVRLKQFLQRNDSGLVRYELPIDDSRSKIVVDAAKMPRGTTNRIFESWITWKANRHGYVSSGSSTVNSYVLAVDSFDRYVELCKKYSNSSASEVRLMTQARRGYAKGTRRGYYKVQILARNVSELSVVMEESLGGRLPFWVFTFRAAEAIESLQFVQEHFNRNNEAVDKVRRRCISFAKKEC